MNDNNIFFFSQFVIITDIMSGKINIQSIYYHGYYEQEKKKKNAKEIFFFCVCQSQINKKIKN